MQLPGGHNKLNSINSMRPGEEMEMPECNQGNQVLPIFGEELLIDDTICKLTSVCL